MNAGQRSVRQLASKSAKDSICISCRETISRRHFASAAAAVQESPANPSPVPPVSQAAGPQQAYQVRAGVVLSRPPVITRDLHPFEKAFFLYQRRLNERQAHSFTRYFYYKKGSPAEAEWKRKQKQRLTAARDIGVYRGHGKDAWNDELLVGAQESEPDHQREALLRDSESTGKEDADVGGKKAEPAERPLSRVTEADQKGDQKSLNRMLQRTLYLLVKDGSGRWQFPQDRLIGRESLHRAAERVLVQSGGINMNTWVVGNHPVGHYQFDFPKTITNADKGVVELGEKVFFMKARIMAGQANLAENQYGLADFKWLAKEEIEPVVTPRYWSAVQDMLTAR
ncbi:Mitochondrial 54s ribosomal protein [Lasiodiplodia theobromae]|uniref:Large ribosomal subunit protein mL46 n=1 Tax=Lasiodiplodia theobromae TaxID=45133 RepID=A0A5N5DND8_9PEZI|nr:Mitochondrial 54s ribosomal protein [Lasiodiplodia theobromae]KAB2578402.1 39S ribosomal protein L46 [Lasiodiplodia theobromae]KAF4544744.1 Mitochondrial 54s ribosomal protein [Lasiodiplodia theobromae]